MRGNDEEQHHEPLQPAPGVPGEALPPGAIPPAPGLVPAVPTPVPEQRPGILRRIKDRLSNVGRDDAAPDAQQAPVPAAPVDPNAPLPQPEAFVAPPPEAVVPAPEAAISDRRMQASVMPKPAPPYSRGMAMPSQPALANSSKNSCGYSPVLSLILQYSQSNFRARLRTSVRMSSCSSVKPKSIDILLGPGPMAMKTNGVITPYRTHSPRGGQEN